MTPHINAKKEAIAKIVLMPGDPLRAKYIAENFLKNVKLVNNVRNMLMYTGTYEDNEITIAGSGMGCPSIGIYSYELFKFYDVDVIIRIGSAGAYDPKLNLYDVINVVDAYSENNYGKIVGAGDSDIIAASKPIFKAINETALTNEMQVISGRIHSSDVFYRQNFLDYQTIFQSHNAIAVEMEAAALFANAKVLNKQAGCLLTISDSLVTKQVTTPFEREQSFNQMITLALKTVSNLTINSGVK